MYLTIRTGLHAAATASGRRIRIRVFLAAVVFKNTMISRRRGVRIRTARVAVHMLGWTHASLSHAPQHTNTHKHTQIEPQNTNHACACAYATAQWSCECEHFYVRKENEHAAATATTVTPTIVYESTVCGLSLPLSLSRIQPNGIMPTFPCKHISLKSKCVYVLYRVYMAITNSIIRLYDMFFLGCTRVAVYCVWFCLF